MATVSFPSRCAVAVICGDHLVSQVYPASVPVEVFIDNAVELLHDDLRRRGVEAVDSEAGYELHRANGTRLDIAKTLDELGVEDGSTLLLVPAVQGDSFEPQYESLSTGLARIGKKLFTPVTAQTAVHTAMALLGMAALTILSLAVHTRTRTDALAAAVATGTAGLTLAAGAAAAWRWWPERRELLTGFAWPAVPLLGMGCAAAAPGALGAAHVFIAAVAIATSACVITAITLRHIAFATAVVVLCVGSGLAAAVRMWRPVPGQWLGMGVLFGLLILLTLAPTLALWTVRIRPPHFGSITGSDVFRRSDGMPVDAVVPVDDDGGEGSGADTTARGAAIAELATRANGVLTGICVAAAIALPVAVWATLMPGRARGNAAAVLALLFILIFISRGRAFADRRQAIALVCGAAAAFNAGVARYVLHSPSGPGAALLWGALVVAGFAGTGLVAALLVPATRFTPLVRMVTEWLELVAIVVAMPLAAWIGGLFSWVRMR